MQRRAIPPVSFRLGLTLRTPGVPHQYETVQSGLVSRGSEVVQIEFVVAIDTCPIQAWTMTRS